MTAPGPRTPREAQLALLQQTFPSFIPFLVTSMKWLGFQTTDIQKDIASFLEYGPKDIMVQAQRGQAKTTITAMFAVWSLIHNPEEVVLIVSAGGKQANEISTLIVKTIMNFPILECLRPDRSKGDRVSVEAFDVHHELKRVNKSPSVACTGVTGNLQGKRAGLLIADDVESQKNSRTAMMRELLLSIIRDFASICSTGRIIYLGTPQSSDSIYNTLPQSGFTVRIWPGRYPTPEQRENYGDMLAPLLQQRMDKDPSLMTGGGADGSQGQAVDPVYLGEEVLQDKERKQGAAFFQLQHMLSTKLADAERYPLKPVNLVVMRLGDEVPVHFTRGMDHNHRRHYAIGTVRVDVSTPQYVSPETAIPSGRVMHVDPAGGGKNGDESGYAVVDQLGGNVFVRAVGGVPGGYDESNLKALVEVAVRWKPTVLSIEKNFGHGSFTHVLTPLLIAAGVKCQIVEPFESGQKETRIIETLEPVMGRGSLVIDEDVLLTDWSSTGHLPADKRQLYTLMFQLTKITRDRGALNKDDRLDALAGAVNYWLKALGQDSASQEQAARNAIYAEWVSDPLGHKRYQNPLKASKILSTIRRRR